MVKSKLVEVDARFGAEWKGKYVFKEVTSAKAEHIVENHTKWNPSTGEIQKQDNTAIQAELIMASCHGQPDKHPLTLAALLEEDVDKPHVPIEIYKIFKSTANELNTVGVESVRFLLERLEENTRTELLASFGYVKSSTTSKRSMT